MRSSIRDEHKVSLRLPQGLLFAIHTQISVVFFLLNDTRN